MKKTAKKSGEKKVFQAPDVRQCVARNPGVTAEEIASDLGAEGRAARDRLGRILRKLRDTGHLKGKGVTRAMKYTVTRKALA